VRLPLTTNVPEHWNRATGPSNWFELSHPPGWESEIDGTILHLTSSDGVNTLTLHCIWFEDGPAQLDADNLSLKEIFPVRRNVTQVEPLEIAYENIGLHGEAVLGPETPWWKRAVTRNEWRHWRVRAIRSDSLCVLAISLQAPDFDPEADTLIRIMLESLQFAVPLADPPSLFADHVLAVAQARFPDHDVQLDERLQLRLGESIVNLLNLYRTYVTSPNQFDEIVESALNTLLEVQNWSPSRLNPQLHEVHGRIMPMLYPESVWQDHFSDFAAQPWVAGLVIMYVVDESESYWYIRSDLLEQWSVSIEELHELSLQNLDGYFEENSMEFMLTGDPEGPRLLLPHRADTYNTARLLSGSFHSSVQDILGREFVVGVPNRDFFVAVSMHSDDMIDEIRQKVAADFDRMDHPLCNRLLLVSSDGVSEYPSEVL
jgi:hypothetical protein